MRVSREQMAENRERILETAATLFRERGFDGVGVADVMKAVGLTHGGFYGHFSSKDDLAAQALGRAFGNANQWLEEAKAAEPAAPLQGIAGRYLSPLHRDDPGHGCPVAALGSDIARQGEASRQAATEGARGDREPLSHHARGERGGAAGGRPFELRHADRRARALPHGRGQGALGGNPRSSEGCAGSEAC